MDTLALTKTRGLYVTQFDTGHSFTYRLLSLREYQTFRILRDSLGMNPWSLHLKVLELCYQGDYNLVPRTLPLGMLVSIGQLIMWLSGDARPETYVQDIEDARKELEIDPLIQHMKKVVLSAFSAYVPEDLDEMPYPDLLRRFALAESLMTYRTNGTFKALDLQALTKPKEQELVVTADHVRDSAAGEDNFDRLDRRLDNASVRKLDQLKKRR